MASMDIDQNSNGVKGGEGNDMGLIPYNGPSLVSFNGPSLVSFNGSSLVPFNGPSLALSNNLSLTLETDFFMNSLAVKKSLGQHFLLPMKSANKDRGNLVPVLDSVSSDRERQEDQVILDGQQLKVIFPIVPDIDIIDIPFRQPTTITAVVSLKGTINYQKAFPLIRITRFTEELAQKLVSPGKKKFHLPVGIPSGSIISVRHLSLTRGLICSSSKKPFENSISIVICIGDKHLGVKMSAENIQMCGAKSRSMILDTVQHILNNLIEVQELLDWISAQPQEAQKVREWVLAQIQGPLQLTFPNNQITYRLVTSPYSPQPLDHLFLRENNQSMTREGIEKLKESIAPEDQSPAYPEEIYQPLAQYLLGLALDFRNYELFCRHLDWLYQLDEIIDRPVRSHSLRTEMVNINYKLDFRIRRIALCYLIEEARLPCRARYNPLYDRHVTVYFPCFSDSEKLAPSLFDDEVLTETDSKRDTGRVRYCTLLVYLTGCVTQSGPTPEVCQKVYRIFMYLISQIRDKIDMTLLKA